MKKIVLKSGLLPGGQMDYKGQYIYKVLSVREGAKGLGEGFPQAEWLDLELEGHCGINGKMEKEKPISPTNPLDCVNHKYYNLEHEVWVKNMGKMVYQSDWTPEEKWAVAVEVELDAEGKVLVERELGFSIIVSDRKNGIIV